MQTLKPSSECHHSSLYLERAHSSGTTRPKLVRVHIRSQTLPDWRVQPVEVCPREAGPKQPTSASQTKFRIRTSGKPVNEGLPPAFETDTISQRSGEPRDAIDKLSRYCRRRSLQPKGSIEIIEEMNENLISTTKKADVGVATKN